jgi:hypothetical protein
MPHTAASAPFFNIGPAPHLHLQVQLAASDAELLQLCCQGPNNVPHQSIPPPRPPGNLHMQIATGGDYQGALKSVGAVQLQVHNAVGASRNNVYRT